MNIVTHAAWLLLFSSISVYAQIGPAPVSSLTTWRVEQNYSIGQAVIRNGVLYNSLVNSNIAFDPAGSPSQWGTTFGTSSGGATLGANTFTGIQSAPAFSGTGPTETVVNMVAGSAAIAPPANAIQFGAPTTVPTSYKVYLPSAAPADPGGDTLSVPQNGGTASWIPGASIVLLAAQTVSSSTAMVSFLSIPQTYKHLKLFVSGSVSSGATEIVYLNFNTDTTAGDYFANTMTMAFAPTITSAGGFSNPGAVVGTANVTANAGGVEATIFGYTSSSQKGYVAQSIGSTFFLGGGIWNNSAAITRIDVSLASAGTWGAGTVMSLYGIN